MLTRMPRDASSVPLIRGGILPRQLRLIFPGATVASAPTTHANPGAEITHDLMAAATRTWVEAVIGHGAHIVHVERLLGGWTSEMRLLRVSAPAGERSLVLQTVGERVKTF